MKIELFESILTLRKRLELIKNENDFVNYNEKLFHQTKSLKDER